MFKNKKGFTVIELIVGIAILVILGGIAYYVSQNKSSADVIVAGKGKATASGTTFSPNPVTLTSTGKADVTVKTNVFNASGSDCVYIVPVNTVITSAKDATLGQCVSVTKNNPQTIILPVGGGYVTKGIYDVYILVRDSNDKNSLFKADGTLTVN